MIRTPALVITCAALAWGTGAQAQPTTSAAAARQLTDALAARKIDTFAAHDPDDPSRFIAALHIPGSQLLVVSARYSAPAAFENRLAQQEYRQAYLDLQGAGTLAGKFFVQDMQADGFDLSERSHETDVVYENGTVRTLVNGDWKGQGLSTAEYGERTSRAETRYVHMLTVLAAALQGTPPAPSPAGTTAQSTTPPR